MTRNRKPRHISWTPLGQNTVQLRGKHPGSIFLCWDLYSDCLPVRGEDERFSLKGSLMIACVRNIIIIIVVF